MNHPCNCYLCEAGRVFSKVEALKIVSQALKDDPQSIAIDSKRFAKFIDLMANGLDEEGKEMIRNKTVDNSLA